jgi:hypothetical protein
MGSFRNTIRMASLLSFLLVGMATLVPFQTQGLSVGSSAVMAMNDQSSSATRASDVRSDHRPQSRPLASSSPEPARSPERPEQLDAAGASDVDGAWIWVDPLEPMTTESVNLQLFVEWVYEFRHEVAGYEFTQTGDTLTFTLHTVLNAGANLYFDTVESVPPLPEGDYTVQAIMVEPPDVNEVIASTDFHVFPYSESRLVWNADVPLISDCANPDPAPSAATHEGQLYVAWNDGSDGGAAIGILSPAGLEDLGLVADCAIDCGPGLASYKDVLYSFFAQGADGIYHLYGKPVNPAGPAFQLTYGDVYDAVGARAVVYRDTLHVFFMRRLSGVWHILTLAFDGTTWSDETIITAVTDDARPAVTVFDDRIYLFYDNGTRYQTFDGIAWSSEYELTMPYDWGITPAAATYGNLLYLFFRYSTMEWDRVYSKRFDGDVWTAARAVPTTFPYWVDDLGCAVHDGELHLLWGSTTAWPSCGVFVKQATDPAACYCPYQCDYDEDTFLTALDLGALIDILFGGDPDIQDPRCSSPKADFDCDAFSTALDLSGLIDHLFASGAGPCDPCDQ